MNAAFWASEPKILQRTSRTPHRPELLVIQTPHSTIQAQPKNATCPSPPTLQCIAKHRSYLSDHRGRLAKRNRTRHSQAIWGARRPRCLYGSRKDGGRRTQAGRGDQERWRRSELVLNWPGMDAIRGSHSRVPNSWSTFSLGAFGRDRRDVLEQSRSTVSLWLPNYTIGCFGARSRRPFSAFD